jgi:UDP:flavonoid glycosyltransferase YjiC (YdhE family)
MKKVLFISGSVGLGHVSRDLAIARELRALEPEIEVSWLASGSARDVIRNAGEPLLPEASEWADENDPMEAVAKIGFYTNVISYVLKSKKDWSQNVDVFKRVTARVPFDLVVGDETYEVTVALKEDPGLKKFRCAFIYDFIGLDSMSANPVEKLGVYVWNRIWAKGYKNPAGFVDATLFVGEPEDIPDRKLGPFLPNRREWARCRGVKYLGYVFPFDPAAHADKAKVRADLGYGPGPLVVCAIGGTSIGKELLELCGQAYPIAGRAVPDLRMVLVCGPRLAPSSLSVPDGVEVKGYIPRLYEHLAACDLAIVQGGGTTTLELTALRRPFIFFPLEGHCEQQIVVAGRLARHGAGLKAMYSATTPESLAALIEANIGKEAAWPAIPVDGARNAARILRDLLAAHA